MSIRAGLYVLMTPTTDYIGTEFRITRADYDPDIWGETPLHAAKLVKMFGRCDVIEFENIFDEILRLEKDAYNDAGMPILSRGIVTVRKEHPFDKYICDAIKYTKISETLDKQPTNSKD